MQGRERLAGEHVDVRIAELLLDDLRVGRARHELLGEAVRVGDTLRERGGFCRGAGLHHAHDLEVQTACDLLRHERLII